MRKRLFIGASVVLAICFVLVLMSATALADPVLTKVRALWVQTIVLVDGDASVGGDLDVTGDTAVTGDLDVTGDAAIGGALTVTGAVISGSESINITSDGTFGGNLSAVDVSASRNITAGSDVVIGGTLDVDGAATITGTITGVAGVVAEDLRSTDDADIDDDLNVDGDAQVDGTLNATTGLSIAAVTFTGAIKYGIKAGEVQSGTTQAHGMGSTPTAGIVVCSNNIYTGTVGILSLGATNITFSVIGQDGDVAKAYDCYWMVGK